MYLREDKTHTIRICVQHDEIIKSIKHSIYDVLGIVISDDAKFIFEFVKEGSPQYSTGKIKCKITQEIDLSQNAAI